MSVLSFQSSDHSKYDIRQYIVFDIPWKSIGAISEFVFAYSQPKIIDGIKTITAIGSL